jgi:hypothetical protein
MQEVAIIGKSNRVRFEEANVTGVPIAAVKFSESSICIVG